MKLRGLTRDRCVHKTQESCLYELRDVIQVEAARTIWDLLKGSKLAGGHERDICISEDQGELRQDRYTLRTAPQFLGPQIEDIISALNSVTIECNSSVYHLPSVFIS
jgi:histidine ammonia-lyase